MSWFLRLQNTVGYTKRETAKDTFYMMAAQFQGIGETATLTLNDIMKMENVMAKPWAYTLDDYAAQITVREGDFYNDYFYITDAYIPGTSTEIGYDSWADREGNAVTLPANKLALGDSFWFKVPSSCLIDSSKTAALLPSGEVYGQNSLERTIVGNKTWQMVGNPFPTVLKNANINMNGYSAKPWTFNLDGYANQLTVRHGDFYDDYFYLSDAYAPGTSTEIGYDCWADREGTAVLEITNPQEGAWMNFVEGAGNIIFMK